MTKFEYNTLQLEEEQEMLLSRASHGSHELQRLEQRNVHQDTFFISTSSTIGEINGFRLGRLPSIPVTGVLAH